MQSIEDCNRDAPSLFRAAWLGHVPLRNPQPNPLLGSCSIEVFDVFFDYPMKLPVSDNQRAEKDRIARRLGEMEGSQLQRCQCGADASDEPVD